MPIPRKSKAKKFASERRGEQNNTDDPVPSTPPSPKAVRFAPHSAELTSRPLTPQEAWSLYHFETHARGCRLCSSHPLCSTGYGLAQDVQILVCQRGGEICSTRPDSEGKWVRVEIPYGYDRAKSMLGIDRRKKHKPIVSYDTDPRPDRKRETKPVIIEPARTHANDERGVRYEVVEASSSGRQAGGEPVMLPERSKRGSLYESDMRRPRREYRIEERTSELQLKSLDQKCEEKEREERRERRRRERAWRGSDGLPAPKVKEGAPRQTTYVQRSVPVQSDRSLAWETKFARYVDPIPHSWGSLFKKMSSNLRDCNDWQLSPLCQD
jgi:hypothetical protein